VIVPPLTRARRYGTPFKLGRAIDVEDLESCSLLCLSASATIPVRHFAASGVASFIKGGIGYREWARRDGRLG